MSRWAVTQAFKAEARTSKGACNKTLWPFTAQKFRAKPITHTGMHTHAGVPAQVNDHAQAEGLL